jgi:hypothetical protein
MLSNNVSGQSATSHIAKVAKSQAMRTAEADGKVYAAISRHITFHQAL